MEKFCLNWNDFQSSIASSFKKARNEEDFCDVTLVSDDEVTIKCHKLVLSSSSSFFRQILSNNPHQHPLLYLSGVNSTDLNFILDYIYQGEVKLFQEQIDSFLNSSQMLKIEGLMSGESKNDDKAFINDHSTFPAETFNVDSTNEAPRKINHKKETVKQENVGAITTFDSNESSEIKTKVREYLEKKDGKYLCTVCQKNSSDLGNMLRHIETHIEGLSYDCQHCGKNFRSVNSLSCHKYQKHKNV